MDQFRTLPPPPPGRTTATGEEGVLEFIIDLETDSRPTPPPPPGAAAQAAQHLAIGRNEPLGDAIGRIGTGLLTRAINGLSLSHADRAVEEASRAIDQARALLRLVRSVTGERAYLFENRRLREAKAELSTARESAALVPALDSVIERFGDRFLPGTFAGLRSDLFASRIQASDAQLAATLEILAGARARYASFTTEIADSFAIIEPGLRDTYAKGQLRMGEAYRHPSDRAFLRWRTQVSYLRDQVAMLDPDWATLGLSDRLRRLARTLGEAHHLSLLRSTLDEMALHADSDERELLRLLVIGRCQDIYQQMLEVGEGLYRDDPSAFTSKFGTYWRSWRDRS